jgi:hypothetical protein
MNNLVPVALIRMLSPFIEWHMHVESLCKTTIHISGIREFLGFFCSIVMLVLFSLNQSFEGDSPCGYIYFDNETCAVVFTQNSSVGVSDHHKQTTII